MQCPPTPGPGWNGREAERLGGRAPDRVPQIDTDLTAEHRHLVDERDVDVPVGVLQQLGHLGFAGALGLDDPVHEALVEGAGGLGAVGRDAADDLGGVLQAEGGVARVDALRGEGEVEVRAHPQPTGLQPRPDDLVGGPRVRRRLQHDERAGPEVCGDVVDGRVHRAEIGGAMVGERRRHTHHDRGRVRDDLGPIGGLEALLAHGAHIGVGDVVHVRAPGVQPLDHLSAAVETDHLQARGSRGPGQRQPHVTESDNNKIHRGGSAHDIIPQPRCRGPGQTQQQPAPRAKSNKCEETNKTFTF